MSCTCCSLLITQARALTFILHENSSGIIFCTQCTGVFFICLRPVFQPESNDSTRFQGFQATIMKSSVDEVREKEIAFLQGNFDNVRFSENYCFAVHKGDAESLTDLIDRYLSLNST